MTVSDLRRGAVLLSCVTQASYTYDTSGNRKSETDLDGKITSYAYDGLGRLTQESETNGRTIGYTYDAAGNRTQMTVSGTESYVTAYTYDANNRLLTETKTQNSETTATTYTYDANGNTLSKSVQQGSDPAEITAYTYDRFNQLVSVTADGIPVYYSYNAEGIRTAKLSCGILTSFLLDGGDVATEVQNDVLQASYLRGINLICREQGGEKEYYLFDAHADVIALTDEDGEETRAYDYDAFGCETQPDPLDGNPFRYCGEYFDIETGSYYLRARYYVPAIGRFTQQDTHWNTANMIYGDDPQKINEREDALGLKNYTYVPQITAVMQAGNQYVYGINDPISYFDYTGMLAYPGQIHNEVVNRIANTYGFNKEQTIIYSFGWGRADLISNDGAVWEVKRNKPYQIACGVKQVAKYTDNIWKRHADVELHLGYNLESASFIASYGIDTYYVTYYYAGNGVIAYDYYKVVNIEAVKTYAIDAGLALLSALMYLLSQGTVQLESVW